LLYGIGGNDSLFANDGKADTVNGGGGNDEATVDDPLDFVRSVESAA
jgi:Ca2+-binding RTX toxin-like protein